jgi:hypothetical protein
LGATFSGSGIHTKSCFYDARSTRAPGVGTAASQDLCDLGALALTPAADTITLFSMLVLSSNKHISEILQERLDLAFIYGARFSEGVHGVHALCTTLTDTIPSLQSQSYFQEYL